jgi:hypothetical protein
VYLYSEPQVAVVLVVTLALVQVLEQVHLVLVEPVVVVMAAGILLLMLHLVRTVLALVVAVVTVCLDQAPRVVLVLSLFVIV